MPSIIAAGTPDVSASPVVNPTVLTPPLPVVRSVGHQILLWTCTTSATATVSTPSGWQVIYKVAGANGSLALFARKVAGGETDPSVTWTGVTTGASGTASLARTINMGYDFGEDGSGLLQVDVQSPVSDASSATDVAGGLQAEVMVNNSIVFAHGVFGDDTLTGSVDAATGITLELLAADGTTSGTDLEQFMSWGVRTPAGIIGDHTWVLTGTAGTFASSGVWVAFLAPPVSTLDDPPTLFLKKGH